jgi:hypothetical protein
MTMMTRRTKKKRRTSSLLSIPFIIRGFLVLNSLFSDRLPFQQIRIRHFLTTSFSISKKSIKITEFLYMDQKRI